jgi:hypothetical protein
MASPETWLEVLATAKAVFDSVKSGVDFLSSLRKYRADASTIQESRRASRVFSTYSDAEIASVTSRLEDCRKRFAAEGSGEQRARCFCSVFKDLADGNGGEIPLIDDWQNMFRQLCVRR